MIDVEEMDTIYIAKVKDFFEMKVDKKGSVSQIHNLYLLKLNTCIHMGCNEVQI